MRMENGARAMSRRVMGGFLNAARMPDLRGGACMSPEGARLIDRASAPNSEVGTGRARDAARFMCNVLCVKSVECASWVAREERPPGAWPMFYAGRTAFDRAKDQPAS